MKKMKFPKKMMRELTTEDKILWALRYKRLTPSALAKLTKKTRSTVSEKLSELVREGKIGFKHDGKCKIFYLRKR